MGQNFRLAGPTNFPEGVASEPKTHPLGSFRALNPFKDIVVADDFLTDNLYTTSDTNSWKVTTLSGTQGSPTVGLVDGLGGVVSIATSNAGAADAILSTQVKPFLPSNSTDLFLYGRFSVADATNAQLILGFVGSTYHLSLFKPTGSTAWVLRAKLGAAAIANFTLGTLPTIANSTYFTIGLRWNWIKGKFVIYFNDQPIFSYMLVDLGVSAFPGELATGVFGVQNGGTGQVNTLLADYVLIAQGRV
jgi:hypothetical protein